MSSQTPSICRRGVRLLHQRGGGLFSSPPQEASASANRCWSHLRRLTSAGAATSQNCRLVSSQRARFSALALDDHDASLPHCRTCTCTERPEEGKRAAGEWRAGPNMNGIPLQPQQQQHPTSAEIFCHQPEPPILPHTPLPPPLPKPNYSFRGRVMPSNLTAFNSTEGKERFSASMRAGNAEAYFPLSQQFINQSDPAYCGMTTLVLVLNALAMDPNVRWRGGWRWYGEESMLLERCCLEEERVRREGVTMAQYCALARCQGVELELKHPINYEDVCHADRGRICGVDEFRRDIIAAVHNPPHTHWDDVMEEEDGTYAQPTRTSDKSNGGYFLVTSFARHALGQTGDGHFSPIAAYHAPSDSCLLLDVARFKYPPYWVSVKELYEAMIPPDSATGKSRGWILMYPPSKNDGADGERGGVRHKSKEEMEGKRPAASVPEAGSGESLCPVEGIKVEYCSAGKR